MADLFVAAKTDDLPGDTHVRRPPDWQEREQALDIRQSWIVEAPAGSGKTGLLIQRFLKLLADESVEDPIQVLAITFTVKATAEMRERVIAQLESASRCEPLKSYSDFDRETRALAEMVLRHDASLGWELLQHPRRLNIRTIDSVCGEVARLLPVLSGAGGRQTPVEDPTLMYREAARETLMQLGGSDVELDAALRTVLLHRDGSLRDCERLLMEMLPLRNQWGELVPLGRQQLDDAFLDQAVLPKLELALEQAVCAGLTRLSLSVPEDILQELASLAGEMGNAEGYRGTPSPIAMCAGLHTTPQETAEDLEHWRALIHLLTTQESKWRATATRNHLGFKIEKNHAERLKVLMQQLRDRDDVLEAIKRVRGLPPVRYPREQWAVAKALFRVLSRALVELQLVFARRGECDFAELGLLAQVALRRDGAISDLSKALGMSLQHLLVDEMQDTSTGQYELIQLLTQRWDGHSQTVFLVGDPKQSIYLFRQARVERFVKTMETELLGDLPVGRLRLTANFRSQSELVEAFNDDFSLLFPRKINAANPEEVPYVEAQAVRGPSRRGSLSLVWHTGVLASETSARTKKKMKRRQAKLEAEQVRAIVEDWRSRPLPQGRGEPWKLAVLVRSRNLLADIVVELKDEAKGTIPFRAVDIEALGQRQEVLDLFALTRAMMHPADRVAWLAVLHAPWCGLGRADLHTLAGGDDPDCSERCIGDLITERLDLLNEKSRARLMRVWPVLQAAQEKRSGLGASQWVERTWRSLGGDASLKPGELANARRYLQLLDEMEKDTGTTNVRLLKRRLDKLFAQPAAGGWAVDLMTIHKSKGLEWDVVIVPGLQKKDPADREKLLTWSEIDSGDSEAAHIMLAPIVSRGEGSKALNRWLKDMDKAKEAAERKRLFYVACTRAREELHLFASPEATARGEVIRPHGSLLATAWPAAERHFRVNAPDSKIPGQMFMMLPKSQGDSFIGDIAAAADEVVRPAMLQRFPMEFNPESRFSVNQKLSYGEEAIKPGSAHFERPEGSFEARAFGNAVHAFLEMLAKRLAVNTRVETVLPEVAGWTPRIAAVLRGDGLQPAVVERLVPRVKTALINMLQDDEGRWVLSQHKQASSELSLSSWSDVRSSVRLDRVFHGGAKPMEPGAGYLWIIDYKTATHGREGIDEFLAEERMKYTDQMKLYAQTMGDRVESGKLRVGLYYPMMPKLVWWEPDID
ncbi:UvrD-helicase domain-containing protein [Tunturiibacter gelidoferens]|uniref:DNA 3'-5' helicase n=1 Tax=Tunturiibacter lichenicola TaxID=2051959 RepID=A0A7Y9NND8_9BACT|nr:ATP-dependent exoDNAse (exonuclease V) beta subunit [Edaphobacter lichenicola]